jgi:glycosyltransferase involved in cell wall biosynthesis
MKITAIGPLPPIKAISPYFLHFSRELSKKVNLEIITFKNIVPTGLYSGGPIEKGLKFEGINDAEIKRVLTWYNPLSWIKVGLKAKGEIIHIQHWAYYTSFIYCFILPIMKIRNKKIVITIHNVTPHEKNKLWILFNKLINKIIFSFVHYFFVHNQRNKEKLMKLYFVDEEKIAIVAHGVLKPSRIRKISKIDARKIIGMPKDKKIILFFGYIQEYKGLDILLESLIAIKKDIPSVVLLIVGQPSKLFTDWKKYENIIKNNNLDDFVIKKLEYVPESDIEIYFSSADLVVLPYKEPFDTHGGVAALTLAFEKPMVVTDIGGLPEYVRDSRAISVPNDVKSLSKKIIYILKDEQLLDKLSKDSGLVAKELTWDKIADKTIEIYKKVCH